MNTKENIAEFLISNDIIQPDKNDLIITINEDRQFKLSDLLKNWANACINDLLRWIPIEEQLPDVVYQEEHPHLYKIEVKTAQYGILEGFYYNDKFMHTYATEILEVTHWRYKNK